MFRLPQGAPIFTPIVAPVLAPILASAGLVALVALAGGCAPRARMCNASAECASASACVAGRCQPEKANVKPAIDNARRLVARPIDIAYVRAGDAPSGGSLPTIATLGRDGARLLLRFRVALPVSANVVEAYLVLHRSRLVDDDPTPISLHATRIVEGWNGRSTSFALQPSTTEMRLPSTRVDPAGPVLVRLDVRELVRQWAKHDSTDQGVAVVAENETPTGTSFALTAQGEDRGPLPSFGTSPGVASPSAGAPSGVGAGDRDHEPYLELYLR